MDILCWRLPVGITGSIMRTPYISHRPRFHVEQLLQICDILNSISTEMCTLHRCDDLKFMNMRRDFEIASTICILLRQFDCSRSQYFIFFFNK